jgi:hypothetical protein
MKFYVGWLECSTRQSREHFLDSVCECNVPESGVYQRWETVPRPGGPPSGREFHSEVKLVPAWAVRLAINVKITRVTSNVWLDFYVPRRLHEAWLTCSVSYVTSIAVVCLRCNRATLFHSVYLYSQSTLSSLFLPSITFFPSLTSLYVPIFTSFSRMC